MLKINSVLISENLITDGGLIPTNVIVDGKRVFLKRINFGSLPNNGSKSVPTGINFDNYELYNIDGIAKYSTNNIAFVLPFASPQNITYAIMVNIDNSNNLVVTTGIDRSGYIGKFNIYVLPKN